jgi:polar amino acid transport system permease protein
MHSTSDMVALVVSGSIVTVELTLLGSALALVLAFAAGLARVSRSRILRTIASIYVEFFRGSSIFVQAFWAFFVLPLLGIPLTALEAAVAVLGLNVGAYAAEVVRGAIQSVAKEQYEAGIALNLTRTQSMVHVIIPQAIPLMLPAFGNNIIELLKATAVMSLITMNEMTFQAQIIRAQTGNTFLPFMTILILYFAMSVVLTSGIRLLERRFRRGTDGVRA